jgi:predicted ATP-grasp superfamily ATP-dependent carboligase
MQPPSDGSDRRSAGADHADTDKPHSGTASPPAGLIIVGASVRAACESASRSGIPVIAVDQFGDCETRQLARSWHRLPEPQGLAETIRDFLPYPVVPVGGLESWFAFLDRSDRRHPVLAPSIATINVLRSPRFLYQIAIESELNYPQVFDPRLGHLPQVRRGVTIPIRWPGASRWLRKSRTSSAGLAVTPVPGPATAEGIDASKVPSDAAFYWQRFTPGRPFGVSYLADSQRAYLIGVCRSVTRCLGDRPFLYAGAVGPVRLSGPWTERLQLLGESVRRRAAVRGLFGIDVLYHAASDELTLLEVNPRLTASMELHQRQRDISLVALHANCYLDGRIETDSLGRKADFVTAKRVVWTDRPIVWDNVASDLLGLGPGTDPPRPSLSFHDIPAIGEAIPSNSPVVTIHSCDSDPVAAFATALRYEKRLQMLLRRTTA